MHNLTAEQAHHLMTAMVRHGMADAALERGDNEAYHRHAQVRNEQLKLAGLADSWRALAHIAYGKQVA